MASGPDGPVPQRSLTSLQAATGGPRGALAQVIPRRPRVSWWLGLLLALGFAVLVTPAMTAERWLGALGAGDVIAGKTASLTVRVPVFAGIDRTDVRVADGGYLIARGQQATIDDERAVAAVQAGGPHGALTYIALFVLALVLAAIFTHHMRRSTRGRLLRVQIVSLVSIAIIAGLVKVLLLMTSASMLVVPVSLLALVPTLALDRIVGLATGILAALVIALLGPFDVGVAILMLVQAAVAGLVVAEQPKERGRAVLTAGLVTTLFTAATYVLLMFLTTGALPRLSDPLHSPWVAAALGPAIATVLALPLVPLYQMLVGEITRGKLIELEDLSNPLLKQIAQRAPGTWQHSLMMANLAEIAANAIGASGRLVRVGAYYHDLGKSLQPKYFIENLEPGETSPHDQLPPEVSCDAIFAHVTEGIVTARKAGLHERIVDFMHMHHGNGVLEYFWGKTKEQGNPNGLSIEQFRYPGHPPQSRETAILAICDAVEAASRTLKKPTPEAIDSLVQRIVYGKLHLGQLDESGLSMADLRQISDSLRETIRHANHGRIEYPWQKAQQDASASKAEPAQTSPRLDSLDRAPDRRPTTVQAQSATSTNTTTAELGVVDTAPITPATNPITKPVAVVAMPRKQAPTEPPIELERKKPTTQPPPDKLVAPARPTPQPQALPPPPAPPPLVAEEKKYDPNNPTTLTRPAKLVPPAPPRAAPPAPSDPITSVRPITAIPEGIVPRTKQPTQPPPSPVEEIAIEELSSRVPKKPTMPPPDGLITSATFGDAPAARKRAATLPPLPVRRAPTIPPPGRRSSPTIPPIDGGARTAGPPVPVDLENATTNPPPMRGAPMASSTSKYIIDERPSPTAHTDVTLPGVRLDAATLDIDIIPGDDARRTQPSMAAVTDDAGTTAPMMPAFAATTARPRSRSLADRVDAQLDEWGPETPLKAPSPEELRALLGQPDPTKEQSIDEIERLHAMDAADRRHEEQGEPEIFVRRHNITAEVTDDDIEAAIEVLPPARRRTPSAIGVAKKKSE